MLFVDGHNDTILKVAYGAGDFRRGGPNLHIDLPKLRSLGAPSVLFSAAWVDPVFQGERAVAQAESLVGRIEALATESPDDLGIAGNFADVEAHRRQNKTSLVPAVESGHALDDDPNNVERLYRRGVRLLTLSHIEAPRWIGSSQADDDRGLDALGRDMIRAMNGIGMIVDVAHVSEKSVRDVARASTRPIVSSHGCARRVFDTKRGLSDDAIRAIAGTGGVFCIMFFPDVLTEIPRSGFDPVAWIAGEFAKIQEDPSLSPEEKAARKVLVFTEKHPRPEVVPGIESVFTHIDHAVNVAGEDHVGIGSDYDGIPYACAGIEDIGKLGNLVDLMRRRGYAETAIDKIMGANLLGVFREVAG